MSDSLPAVAESDAQGDVAALFADIRATYRVGVVNLVWRHLATIEGALPWAWGAVKPLYVSGHVAAAASAIRAARPLPPVAPLPAEVTACAGLDPAARAEVARVIGAYDRANPMALAALSLLQARLSGGIAPGEARAPLHEDAAEVPLPPLPALEGLAPPVAALVRRANAIATEGDAPILASLYRHLALWPPALALSWAVLAPREAALRQAIAATRALALDEAARLAPLLPEAPPPPAPEATHAALARFTGDAIGRMVVLGGVLAVAFGPEG